MIRGSESRLLDIFSTIQILLHLFNVDLLQVSILFVLDEMLENLESSDVVLISSLPVLFAFASNGSLSKVSNLLTVVTQVRHILCKIS